MTTNAKTKNGKAKAKNPTKHKRVIDLLSQNSGASRLVLSTATHWLPHSTRAFLTGLKKNGFVIVSEKTYGIRRYRATPAPSKCEAK